MRIRTSVALIAIVALAAVPGLGGVASAAPTTTVKLGDNFFKPARKTIRRGTKVRFKWVGRNPHNVTKRKGPGGRFKSRTTSRRGVNFVKRFTKRGTYKLICTIHPEEMRLTIKVR
jgi:plastocyanin